MYSYSTIVSSVLFASLGLSGVRGAPAPTPGAEERWFQPRDSTVASLFQKRQTNPSDPGTLYSNNTVHDQELT